MKRSVCYLLASLPLGFSTLVQAKPLSLANAAHASQPARVTRPASRTPTAPLAYIASVDEGSQVPTFLWAARGFSSTRVVSTSVAGRAPEVAARLHLAKHAAQYGLSKEALSTAEVTQVHDIGRGGILVVMRQRVGGIEVFHHDVKVLMDRQLELVAIGGNLHPAAVSSLKGARISISEPQAIAAAFHDLYGLPAKPSDLVLTKTENAGHRIYELGAASALRAKGLHLVTPVRIKPIYFPFPGRLVPAYFFELLEGQQSQTTSDAYAYVVAAEDGRLLVRQNLTHTDTFHYRVFADATGDHRPMDGPIADFTPHPTGIPDGSSPAFASSSLISMDGFNKFHDPWLPTGATESTGKNVDAYTDDQSPDGFSGGSDLRATTTKPDTFDRVFDPTLGPQSSDTQRMASVTDLFYVTNYLHDWWYDSGFDEAAGNAQQDNYGRGGVAGDPLIAQAQDGAPNQRNNSDMTVASDGISPRMQMYVWDGKGISSLGVQPLNQSLSMGFADFGPQSFNVAGALALINDGNATVTDACQPITNAITGKIALIDRGFCTFKQKAAFAQAAGAIGVLVADNQGNQPPPPMADGTPSGAISIPVVSVTMSDGKALKDALQNGQVTVSMSRSTAVDRDGTVDHTVVAHEWGHYIHLRQVACGSAQCNAQSEGWGDFFALHMMVRNGDALHGTYAVAAYATVASPEDPAYFGIRRYPYSVDTTKNPLTFRHISHGEPLPGAAPVAASTAQIDNAEAHSAGEIWATMLFEGMVALLERSQGSSPLYTFEEARRRMGDYVEGGLKMAPFDPTYTEQRDAILATAAAADLSDMVVLAEAFARRGAGTCAVSPPRNSTDLTGVVESFTNQPVLSIVSVKVDDTGNSCDQDGILDAGETGTITITAMNTGTAASSGGTVTVSAVAPEVLFPAGQTATFGNIQPFGTGTATLPMGLTTTVATMETLSLKAVLANAPSCAAQATFETAPFVNFDEVSAASTLDTCEAPSTSWTLSGEPSTEIWSRVESPLGNHVWAGIDYPSPTDTALVSPPLQVSASEPLVLRFDHRHAFEADQSVNWDGAVIEVSTDGGSTWEDITMYGNPSYSGVIGDPQGESHNVLLKRQGYVGTNPSWPSMNAVTISLGTSLANKTVQVRFRIGTDDAQGDKGWELDNIQLTGITNQPFPSLVQDKAGCGAAPIAVAGPDQTVTPGATVALDGSASFDPGGVPLTFAWKETAGTKVSLDGANTSKAVFVAPLVTAPTTLTFELMVSDGKLSAIDSVNVVVAPSTLSDAGVDGGSVLTAGGGGGCGCGTAGAGPQGGAAAALLVLQGLYARRRRRG